MRHLTPQETAIVYALASKLTGSASGEGRRLDVILQNVARRMSVTGCETLSEYLAIADGDAGEARQLLSAITIHTTSWFREPEHFDRVRAILARPAERRDGPFLALCAACSTGEEAWSLAMTLEEKRLQDQSFDYRVLAFDIDPVSVAKAKAAVYPEVALASIPRPARELLRLGSGRAAGFFVPSPEIRQRVQFVTGDLRAIPQAVSSWGNKAFDLAICRNVLIYFDAPSVDGIVRNLARVLRPGGHLLLGHSEAVDGARHGLSPLGRAIYQLPEPKALSVSGKPVALIVDDSTVIRKVIANLLANSGFTVVEAESAAQADEALARGAVDLVTLDLNMPGEDGATWLKRQRAQGFRAPVVIVSDSTAQQAEKLLGVITSIAQDYVEKGELSSSPSVVVERLNAIVKQFRATREAATKPRAPRTNEAQRKRRLTLRPEVVLVGASTGGTDALVKVLAGMPIDSPPLLVVQHISQAFAKAFADRLAVATGLPLGNFAADSTLKAGHLYMATGDYHLTVKRVGDGPLRLIPTESLPEFSCRPSVEVLFRSAAAANVRAVAMLLTGMGRDGAQGLLELKQSGGTYTLAQDEASCVVYGMPKEAMRLGAVDCEGDLRELRTELDRVLSLPAAPTSLAS